MIGMTLSQKQSIELYFDQFEGAQPLSPTQFIGDNVRLAFDENSKMSVEIAHETYVDLLGHSYDALVMRGSNRAEHDWLALEVDVDPQFEKIAITMRYAPAEFVYPRFYVSAGKKRFEVEFVGMILAFGWVKYEITGAQFDALCGSSRKDMSQLRLAMQFASRPWFALGISRIEQEVK